MELPARALDLLEHDRRPAALDELRSELTGHVHDGAVRLQNVTWLVVAESAAGSTTAAPPATV